MNSGISRLQAWRGFNPGLILSSIVWFFGIALILAVLSGITGSFISLAIPVVMYQEVGIITAIKQILGRFKEDWRQIAVYWVVRFFAWAAGAIVVGLAAVILFIIIFLILLIPALILYFILSALGGSFLFWALMIPYGLIALVVLIIFLLIISVPLPVFMKYHLLTFMEIWYLDVRIPLDYPDNFPISTEEQRKKTPDKNINELDKQKKIPFSLTRREAIATMLIVLLIIMVYTGFLLLRGWSLPPDAQVKVNYNYTVNVGEVIGLTLAGIGVAFAGVAYAYKMWAEGKG